MAANYGTMTQAELVQALNAANAAQAAQVRAFYDAAAATNGGWQRMTQGADTIPAAALAAYPAVASALAALENNVYQDQATQIGAALGQLATSPSLEEWTHALPCSTTSGTIRRRLERRTT